MPPDVGFAMLPYVDDGTIFRVELTYCMVTCYASVLTQSNDNFVL